MLFCRDVIIYKVKNKIMMLIIDKFIINYMSIINYMVLYAQIFSRI